LNLKIKALFLDFDGTISSITLPATSSAVPPQTLENLKRIGQQIPIGIITSKSLPFIIEKTPFAIAWSGLGGLETKIRDEIIRDLCLQKSVKYVKRGLQYAKSLPSEYLTIEEKSDSEGKVAAFSVDWRYSKNPKKARASASRIAAYCETLPVCVIKYRKQPFFDVFPKRANKGKALKLLRQKLALHDGVLYMGDSATDNPAFLNADLSIGVLHKETSTSLTCDYLLEFENVAMFFKTLLENNMLFNSKICHVIRKGRVSSSSTGLTNNAQRNLE
jgi:HAD superfamily hydrolase (TIGR01484 family)